jgi:hypothetical protein
LRASGEGRCAREESLESGEERKTKANWKRREGKGREEKRAVQCGGTRDYAAESRTPLDDSHLLPPALLSTLSSHLSRAASLPDGSQSLAVDPPRGRVKQQREGEASGEGEAGRRSHRVYMGSMSIGVYDVP